MKKPSFVIRAAGAVATLLSTLLVAGCPSNAASGGDAGAAVGTKPAATTAGGPTKACALVTAAEATAALGTPATIDEAKNAGASSRCTYDATGGGLIVIVSDQGKAAFDKGHAAAAGKAPAGFSELSGIGEGAFATFGGPLASVMFYKGSAAVTIILTVQSAPKPPVDKATTLAKTAATRI